MEKNAILEKNFAFALLIIEFTNGGRNSEVNFRYHNFFEKKRLIYSHISTLTHYQI